MQGLLSLDHKPSIIAHDSGCLKSGIHSTRWGGATHPIANAEVDYDGFGYAWFGTLYDDEPRVFWCPADEHDQFIGDNGSVFTVVGGSWVES